VGSAELTHCLVTRTTVPQMGQGCVHDPPTEKRLTVAFAVLLVRAKGVKPRSPSFKGAVHTVRAFEEANLYDPTRIEADLPRLLPLIGKKRVGNRPNRYDPRAVKRRPKPHPLLTMPRKKAKSLIERGIIPYNIA
jgi:hypothetical protein